MSCAMVRASSISSPMWAQGVICAATVLSWYAVITLAPLYFNDDETGHVGYIVCAVPGFILLILLERAILAVIDLASTGAQYTVADTWSSLGAGAVQQLVHILGGSFAADLGHRLIPFLMYQNVWTSVGQYTQHHVLDMMYTIQGHVLGHDEAAVHRFWTSGWVWVGAFIVGDFLYYWTHRWAHEVALFWDGHRIHHTSDHYNFSTALRQSWFQNVYSLMIDCGGAVVGIPPVLYASVRQFNTIYQFWVHTCIVRELGILDIIFMTPSNHRIHHDRRVHKNFGGTLVVWDRLFGTYLSEPEQEALQSQDEQDAKTASDVHMPPTRVSEAVVSCDDDTKDRKNGLHDSHANGTTRDVAPRRDEICLFGTLHAPSTWTDAILQPFVTCMDGIEYCMTHYHAMGASKSLAARLAWLGPALGRSIWVGPGFTTTTAPRRLRQATHSCRLRDVGAAGHTAPLRWHVSVHFVWTLIATLVVLVPPKAWCNASHLVSGGQEPRHVLIVLILLTLVAQGLTFDRAFVMAGVLEVVLFTAQLVCAQGALSDHVSGSAIGMYLLYARCALQVVSGIGAAIMRMS